MHEIGRWLALEANAKTAGFASALACVWIASFLAFRVPRKTPLLFRALSLFALNWAVVLLYYVPEAPQDEILACFSGFLLVYVGLLLMREGRHPATGPETGKVGWPEGVPLFLFRATVGGFGAYLIAQRWLRIEYGYGTLALAMWGTLLTVLGYAAVWLGLTALYRGRPAARRVGTWLGVLLLVYSGCEVAYSVWYARAYWPPYHRFLRLQSRPGLPDFDQPLPFQPQPDWPQPERWRALVERPDLAADRRTLSLKVTPRVPDMPAPLEYAFAVLKLLFTGGVILAVWQRPRDDERMSG